MFALTKKLCLAFCMLMPITELKAETLVRSKTRALFVTGWAQSATQSQTTRELVPDKNTFNFTCPGQSFLVGFDTNWDGVRHFRFTCAFYENSSGKLASKTAEQCDAKDWDNAFYAKGDASCPAEQFSAGLNVSYDASKRDLRFKNICCPVEHPEQKKVTATACTGPIVLNATGSSAATGMKLCAGDMAVQKISSEWAVQGTSSDRKITYQCCQLTVN